MPHGRTDEHWQSMMEAARNIMVHTARRQDTITYTDLNHQTAKDAETVPFDLTQDTERNALGTLLADIVTEDLLHSRFLLSSVATLPDHEQSPAQGPGSGFYTLAEHLGHLETGATQERQHKFWAQQLNLTHDHYKRRI